MPEFVTIGGDIAPLRSSLSALTAFASWAVGDATLADLVTKAPVIFGGLCLVTFGVKVNGANALTAGKRVAR